MRNQRQIEFANKWLETKFGILYLAPRFGKIRTTIHCLEKFNNPKILVIHPLETIKKSWEEDFKKWDYNNNTITYSTTASLWKLAELPELFDVIIADEIHLFSPANLKELNNLIKFGNRVVLGLSGTISDDTKLSIFNTTGLPILAYYSIEQGIKEKVITDYEITVILTNLDDKIKHIQPSKKKFFVTEKERYDWLTEKIDAIKAKAEDIKTAIDAGKPLAWPNVSEMLGLLPLHRMHVLKKSIAKLNLTKRLIEKFKSERVLIFCGVIETANKLGIPVYHSKERDERVKDNFCKGIGNHLATVDMFEAGVTVKPIQRAIINSFDSNPENLSQRISRLTGLEYDNLDKKALIYIICTDTIERKWLAKALDFFDLAKVKYITIKD